MIDHVSFAVSDFARAKAFYDAALAPLGVTALYGTPGESLGYGRDGKPAFWIGASASPNTRTHIAFTADDRAAVDAFYAAAMAAGGRDNGGPGVRAHYHPNYYGAFVFDPDGNNIEAVCHKPG